MGRKWSAVKSLALALTRARSLAALPALVWSPGAVPRARTRTLVPNRRRICFQREATPASDTLSFHSLIECFARCLAPGKPLHSMRAPQQDCQAASRMHPSQDQLALDQDCATFVATCLRRPLVLREWPRSRGLHSPAAHSATGRGQSECNTQTNSPPTWS